MVRKEESKGIWEKLQVHLQKEEGQKYKEKGRKAWGAATSMARWITPMSEEKLLIKTEIIFLLLV